MDINWNILRDFIRCERISYLSARGIGQDKVISTKSQFDRKIVKKLGLQLFAKGKPGGTIEVGNKSQKSEFENNLSVNGVSYHDITIIGTDGITTFIDLIIVFNNQITVIEFQPEIAFTEPNHNFILGLHYSVLNQFDFEFKVDFLLFTVAPAFREGFPAGPTLSRYFVKHEATKKAELAGRLLDKRIIQLKQLIRRQTYLPPSKKEEKCLKPEKCTFFHYCWVDAGRLSITNLESFNRKSLDKFIQMGITTVDRIPNQDLSSNQRREIRELVEYIPSLNYKEISKFFKKVQFKYDSYQIIEIKAINSVLPIINGTTPYQRLPIQITYFNSEESLGYQNYNLFEDSTVYNIDLLVDRILSLIVLNIPIVYFDEIGYDDLFMTMIKLYPKRKDDINLLRYKAVNIYPIFKEGLYVDKYMHYDYSLASVVKTMFPNIEYRENFELDAQVASNQFLLVGTFKKFDHERLIKTIKFLGSYKVQTLRDVVLKLNNKVLSYTV